VRNARRLLSLKLNSVGKNFITSLGYTPRLYNYDALNDTTRRLGYYQADGFAEFDFYPASQKKINMTLITFAPAIYWFRDGKFSEANLDLAYTILTADRKSFKIGYVHNFSNLPFETSIFSSLNNLEARSYSSGVAVLRYESNFLKPFSWTADIQGGGYYNGKRLSIYGEVKKRIQPWLNLGTGITWNYIELNKRSIVPVIINPSVEVAFNNKLFLTTFMQYNSLVHNFNLNTRFNWRFSPMSDIYLVFNSNYITPSYHNSGSTLTLKLSYWIN
jgi:hypothetical protein